jgi:acetamidase/formamidase
MRRWKIEVREAIDFLVTEKHLTREDAYRLCSVAVDFNVTQARQWTEPKGSTA